MRKYKRQRPKKSYFKYRKKENFILLSSTYFDKNHNENIKIKKE